MDTILHIDRIIFEFIHFNLGNYFFDYYLPVLRSKYTWIPVYVYIVSYILFNYKKEALLLLSFVLLTVGTADSISSHVIKKNVKRIRPCNTEEMYTVPRVSCGSGYSFTSSHASNHFALSMFLILSVVKRRSIKILLLFWAFTISFSQIYVGVHYPLDVIAGGILGVIIAYSYWILFEKIASITLKKSSYM